MNRLRIISGVLCLLALVVLAWALHGVYAIPTVVKVGQPATTDMIYFYGVYGSLFAAIVFGLLALVPAQAPRLIAAFVLALLSVAGMLVGLTEGAESLYSLPWCAGAVLLLAAPAAAIWVLFAPDDRLVRSR